MASEVLLIAKIVGAIPWDFPVSTSSVLRDHEGGASKRRTTAVLRPVTAVLAATLAAVFLLSFVLLVSFAASSRTPLARRAEARAWWDATILVQSAAYIVLWHFVFVNEASRFTSEVDVLLDGAFVVKEPRNKVTPRSSLTVRTTPVLVQQAVVGRLVQVISVRDVPRTLVAIVLVTTICLVIICLSIYNRTSLEDLLVPRTTFAPPFDAGPIVYALNWLATGNHETRGNGSLLRLCTGAELVLLAIASVINVASIAVLSSMALTFARRALSLWQSESSYPYRGYPRNSANASDALARIHRLATDFQTFAEPITTVWLAGLLVQAFCGAGTGRPCLSLRPSCQLAFSRWLPVWAQWMLWTISVLATIRSQRHIEASLVDYSLTADSCHASATTFAVVANSRLRLGLPRWSHAFVALTFLISAFSTYFLFVPTANDDGDIRDQIQIQMIP